METTAQIIETNTQIPEPQVNEGIGFIALNQIDSSPWYEHQNALLKTPDIIELGDSSRGLGSLRIDIIEPGSAVPLGDKIAIEADFQNIDTLDEISQDSIAAFKIQIQTAPEYEKFRQRISTLTDEDQSLAIELYFATSKALKYFGQEVTDKTSDKNHNKKQRDKTYDDYSMNPDRLDGLKIKPLSECGGNALCTEYSIFVLEAMRRMGREDLVYVAAEKQVWNDEPSFYHSFLTTKDGLTIIDPLETAQYFDYKLPYGIQRAQTSLFESNEAVKADGVWGNPSRKYSLVPFSQEAQVQAA